MPLIETGGGPAPDKPPGAVRVLFLGDVFARPGRTLVIERLAAFKDHYQADLSAANAENASGGLGLSPREARALLAAGLDVLTTGNHVWRQSGIGPFLAENPRVLRPANYPRPAPGSGAAVVTAPGGAEVGFLNLEGRTFMSTLEDPFRIADEQLAGLAPKAQVVIVDFHAEATSEKAALAHYLDGRVGAVIGTHTHVQTADARVLPGGTGFITDAGMTGVEDSIIGLDKAAIIRRFIEARPTPFKPAQGQAVAMGVVIDLDPGSGRCLGLTRFRSPA
jgi:metallophosphoesterase (TIGR00282 family)